MDRERFDALARLLTTTGSRRAALGTLLGVGLLGRDPDALAKRGKGNRHEPRQRRGQRRRQDQERRRKDRNKNGGQLSPPPPQGGGDQSPPPPGGECCGAEPCAAPTAGSERAGCNFAEQSLAGMDLHGAILRRIDGKRANFADADARGADFANACLNEATFRGAKLAGATWDGACLVAADFTGADLGGHPESLNGAVLCGAIMPDGTRNDRDCTREVPCCLSARGGPPTCNTTADCPNAICQTKWCDFPCQNCGGVCLYEEIDGPSQNELCGTVCCDGDCCPSNAYVCDEDEQCCSPGSPTDCDQSGACAAACSANCAICVNVKNGALQCGANALLSCGSCTSNADCPASFPQCVTGYTLRNTSVPLTAAQICRNFALTASCATIFPC